MSELWPSTASEKEGEADGNEKEPILNWELNTGAAPHVDSNSKTTVEGTNMVASLRGAATEIWKRMSFLLRLPAFMTHCMVAAVRNAGGYALGAWLQVFLVRRHGLTPSQFTPWLMVIIPLGMDAVCHEELHRLTFSECRWRPWSFSWWLASRCLAQGEPDTPSVIN